MRPQYPAWAYPVLFERPVGKVVENAEMSDTLHPLKFPHLSLQRGNGYQVLPVLHPAFDLDRITITDPFFKCIDREPLVAGPADNGPFIMPVTPLVRVAGDAGVEEGEDLVLDLEDEEVDVLVAGLEGKEQRYLRFELRRVDRDF